MPASKARPALGATLLLLVSVIAGGGAASGSGPREPATLSKTLRRAVTNEGVFAHLEKFQAIADANGGNRAAGTPGYRASARYVTKQLTRYGWKVKRDPFEYTTFAENSPSVLERTAPDPKSYTAETDYVTGTFSAGGDVTAEVVAVDLLLPPAPEPASTSGCEAADFEGLEMGGKVALLQRGTCVFAEKVANAQAAGAAAVIIFNEGQPDRRDVAAVGLESPGTIPLLGATFAVGDELAGGVTNGPTGSAVRVRTDTKVTTARSENVLAERKGTRGGRVVMAGGHLDSVPAGPGINDNGSGAAALIELARQISRARVRPRHTLRFAWWGAEEVGYFGSAAYLEGLSQKAHDAIALYLNFDMIASPNYARIVSDGNGSQFPAELPLGTAAIERTWQRYFSGQGLASGQDRFVGSDDVTFIDAGIPSGFLYTGSDEIKTDAQQAAYGGTAGEALDPCYHQACDDIDNINPRALREMSDAMAHAVATYAMDLKFIPRRP